MKTNNLSSISYDNEFRWAYVWQFLLFALVALFISLQSLIVVNFLMNILTGVPLGAGNWVAYIWAAGIGTVLILLVVAIKYFPRISTGKYCIMGDNLIVSEKYLSSNANLTIPISCITEVQRTSYITSWSRFWKEKTTGLIVPFRMLEITVGDQKYLLYCVTHAEELYAELSKRIEKNKNN